MAELETTPSTSDTPNSVPLPETTTNGIPPEVEEVIAEVEEVLDEIEAEDDGTDEDEEDEDIIVEMEEGERSALPPASLDSHFNEWETCFAALRGRHPMTGLNLKDIIDSIPLGQFFDLLKEYNREQRSIRRLIFGANEMTKEAAQQLKDFLSFDNVIEELSLRWNLMREAGASELSTALLKNRSLTSLELEGNELADGVAWIAEAIKSNPRCRIRYLGLRQNEINDLGIDALSAAIESAGERFPITSLDLSINYITPDSITSLAKALQNNSSVVHLALNDNNVAMGAPLADLLMENATLTALELRNASLGPEDIKSIVDSLYNNSAMKRVQLLFNYFDLEAEISCQQLQLDRPDIELIWKEHGASTNWRQDEIEFIIDKLGAGKILSVLLNHGSLEPLIDNNLLLPNLVLDDSQALSFLDEMFQSTEKSLDGLDILLILLDCERERESSTTIIDNMDMDVNPDSFHTPTFENICELPPLAKAVSANIDIIGEIISKEDRPGSVGAKRMRFAELLSFILKMHYIAIIRMPETLKTLTIAWDLLFKYPNNNTFHSHLTSSIISALDVIEVQAKLLTETSILETTASILQEECAKPPPFRKGYIGHLILIAQAIKRSSDVNEDLRNIAFGNEKWKSFVDTHYDGICAEQHWVLVPYD